MWDSVDGGGIIKGIIVVAAVIIDSLGIIDGAIDVIVGAFAAAATDFERANFGARPPWGFVRFDFVEVVVVDGIVRIRRRRLLWS